MIEKTYVLRKKKLNKIDKWVFNFLFVLKFIYIEYFFTANICVCNFNNIR